MPDPNKSMNDFEMGGEKDLPVQPKINRYTQDIKEPQSPQSVSPSSQPRVQPTAAAPQAPEPLKMPEPPKPQAQPIPQAPPTPLPTQPSATRSKPVDPAARKKAIIGCLGAFGGLLLILLIMSFVFIAQSSLDQVSPIARLLGINQGSFINGLITFVHIIFIVIALGAFTFTMIGLFRASMAKKDDKFTRRNGLKMSMISGSTLILVLIIWAFVYLYMDSKRIPLPDEVLQPIITEPADPLNLVGPIEVKFDASNVPINKNRYVIAAHEWDFGDGSIGSSQITSHVYEEIGIYNVVLVVKARDLDTGEIVVGGEYTTTVSVASLAIKASFTATPQSGEAPLEVEFDASASVHPTGIIDRYLWDFNEDGIFTDAEGPIAKNTFEKIGKYMVALQVVSTTGETNIFEKEIDVIKGESPLAVITVLGEPKEFTAGIAYTFKGDTSSSPNGKITEYQWSFGDAAGTKDTATATYVFTSPGTYEVVLKVTDEEDKEGEITKIVKVTAPMGTPKAVILSNPPYSTSTMSLEGKAPLQVIFDGRQSTDSDDNIVDYEWDFDDGSAKGFGNTITHTFAAEGTYSVALSVIDADKNVGKSIIVVKVGAQGIVPALEVDKLEGTVPLTVNFDASGSTYADGQITSYRWDFGDGSQAKLGSSSISYRYTSIGIFTATVTIIGADNTTATKSVNITVREVPLQACFTSVFNQGPAPLETSFDPGCSTGTITSYLWDFGDGSKSTVVKPSHIFATPGTYNVTLEVSDAENAVSSTTVTITVT